MTTLDLAPNEPIKHEISHDQQMGALKSLQHLKEITHEQPR